MPEDSLYFKRSVSDEETTGILKNCLDQWASHIPFSPIKVFSQETEIVDITEYSCYTVILTTQIQNRFFTERQTPFHGQSIPETPLTEQDYDIWSIDFPLKADFKDHVRSRDLPDTGHVYECSGCDGVGILRCSDCRGSGKVNCSNCHGAGYLKQEEEIPYEEPCGCGNGLNFANNRPCSNCGGSGRTMNTRYVERTVPCTGGCAATGKVDCGRCYGDGKVTCARCEGQRSLLGYLSADQTEKTIQEVMYYIPPELSKLGNESSPVSDITGTDVFVQDEKRYISDFKIGGQPASNVLTGLAEKCREDSAKHSGRIERQRLRIQRCSVYEYRYRHNKRDYLIYINPVHKLVKDVDGPIASALERTEVEARDLFNRGQLAEAYRANLIALSRGGTEKDKNLRSQIQNSLLVRHISIACISSLIASVIFFQLASRGWLLPESSPRLKWIGPLIISVLCSVFTVFPFHVDPMIRMKSWQARLVSVLIGLACAIVFINPEVGDIGKLFLICLPMAGLLFMRKNFRHKLLAIEESECVRQKNTEALETFLNSLKPSNKTGAAWCMCLGLLCVFLFANEVHSRKQDLRNSISQFHNDTRALWSDMIEANKSEKDLHNQFAVFRETLKKLNDINSDYRRMQYNNGTKRLIPVTYLEAHSGIINELDQLIQSYAPWQYFNPVNISGAAYELEDTTYEELESSLYSYRPPFSNLPTTWKATIDYLRASYKQVYERLAADSGLTKSPADFHLEALITFSQSLNPSDWPVTDEEFRELVCRDIKKLTQKIIQKIEVYTQERDQQIVQYEDFLEKVNSQWKNSVKPKFENLIAVARKYGVD